MAARTSGLNLRLRPLGEAIEQLSLMDALPVAAPVGLEYHPDFLPVPDEEGLLARIDSSEWLTDLSRRVMHFGYKYDYTSRRLDGTARIGPLPEWLAQLSSGA